MSGANGNGAAPPNPTDMGNGIRLAHYFGDRLRYCHPWNRWLVYADGRWQPDQVAIVTQMAKKTVAYIYREASDCEDDTERGKLIAHAKASESKHRMDAMKALCASEPGIPVLPDALDANHDLINFQNGTLALSTGALRPHASADLITTLLPYDYGPGATCPLWTAFLARVFDNRADMLGFIQRAVGYSLTGRQNEQCFFFLYGSGANGKSVFLRTLRDLFGDAARTANFSTFLRQRDTGRPRPDLARLAGARLVTSAEAGEGQRFDEELLKSITGGERVTARKLYADDFEFTPQFTLWLAANHRPTIAGTDLAIWRRVCLVPFTVTIPEEERIDFDTYCHDLAAELPGIMNWALAGHEQWRTGGLQKPADVVMATEEYRAESDVLADFVERCCDTVASRRCSAASLYASYKQWCGEVGEEVRSQKWLSGRMRERGFHGVKSMGLMVYHGIAPINRED